MAPPKKHYSWHDLKIEQTGTSVGHCDCCGSKTERVWGFVHLNTKTVAAYFVTWTNSRPDHGASFDLVMGEWGDSTSDEDRYSVALEYRVVEHNPSFMVVNSIDQPHDYSSIAKVSLNREDVIGTPLARDVFKIVDGVYMSEALNDIRSWQEK